MKTLHEIKADMDEIQVTISTGKGLKKAFISKLKKRYSFLKLCRMYLESEPSMEFLQAEKGRLSKKIRLIDAGYQPNLKFIEQGLRKEEQKEHKDYNKIMQMPKWKEQLRSINFLIS